MAVETGFLLSEARLAQERPGIYALWFTASAKRYVGSSKNVRRRLYHHHASIKNELGSCKLREALGQFGAAKLHFDVLEYCQSEADLEAREQHWARYNPRLNTKPVNRKGVEKQAAKMREIHAENRRLRMEDPAYWRQKEEKRTPPAKRIALEPARIAVARFLKVRLLPKGYIPEPCEANREQIRLRYYARKKLV